MKMDLCTKTKLLTSKISTYAIEQRANLERTRNFKLIVNYIAKASSSANTDRKTSISLSDKSFFKLVEEFWTGSSTRRIDR